MKLLVSVAQSSAGDQKSGLSCPWRLTRSAKAFDGTKTKKCNGLPSRLLWSVAD